jgi:hypothetical protein
MYNCGAGACKADMPCDWNWIHYFLNRNNESYSLCYRYVISYLVSMWNNYLLLFLQIKFLNETSLLCPACVGNLEYSGSSLAVVRNRLCLETEKSVLRTFYISVHRNRVLSKRSKTEHIFLWIHIAILLVAQSKTVHD